MVRATRKTLSWARADKPSSSTLCLSFPGDRDIATHLLAGDGADASGGQFVIRHCRDFDMNVDPVHQRSRNFGHITFDLRRRAVATAAGIAAVAARARVGCGDEHEVGREGGTAQGAGDGDNAVFDRLSHYFERLAVKLGQFVQKEDTVTVLR